MSAKGAVSILHYTGRSDCLGSNRVVSALGRRPRRPLWGNPGQLCRRHRAGSGHRAIEVCTLLGQHATCASPMPQRVILLTFVAMFGMFMPELLRADDVILRMTGPDGRTKTFNPSHPPRRGEEPIINKLLTYRETAEECRKAAEIIRLETDVHNPYETRTYEVTISEAFGFCRLSYYAIVMMPWKCSTDGIGFCLRSLVQDEFSLALPYGSATDSRLLPERLNSALIIFFDITNLDSASKFTGADQDCRVVFFGMAHPSRATDHVFILEGNVTLSAPCFTA